MRMHCRRIALIAMLLTLGASLDYPVVMTKNGAVRGFFSHGRAVFRGIPYAAPPLGDYRLRPPQPTPSWSPSVRDATEFGAICLQSESWKSARGVNTSSEDCLYLNVYAPQQQHNLPVMVYFPAGEFLIGGSNDEESNFPFFSTKVVLVTVGYRVGWLGFAALDPGRGRALTGSGASFGEKIQETYDLYIQLMASN